MDKYDQSTALELNAIVFDLAAIVRSLSDIRRSGIPHEQRQTSTVSINNGGWVIGVAIGSAFISFVAAGMFFVYALFGSIRDSTIVTTMAVDIAAIKQEQSVLEAYRTKHDEKLNVINAQLEMEKVPWR